MVPPASNFWSRTLLYRDPVKAPTHTHTTLFWLNTISLQCPHIRFSIKLDNSRRVEDFMSFTTLCVLLLPSKCMLSQQSSKNGCIQTRREGIHVLTIVTSHVDSYGTIPRMLDRTQNSPQLRVPKVLTRLQTRICLSSCILRQNCPIARENGVHEESVHSVPHGQIGKFEVQGGKVVIHTQTSFYVTASRRQTCSY